MALINCPECNRQVSDQAAACPECGHPIANQEAGASPQTVMQPGPGQTRCVNCGNIVSEKAVACLACGKNPRQPTTTTKRGGGKRKLAIGIVALLAIGSCIAAVSNSGRTSSSSVDAIPGKVAAAAKPPTALPTPLPGPGQTIQQGGWEVTLMGFGPYDRFDARVPATKAQGRLVVADMRIRNAQNSTSNFTTSDFELKSADGRTFKPAGQTANIDRGFVISQTVQPGLTTENRVVFDIDPSAQGLTFTALKVAFSVPNP